MRRKDWLFLLVHLPAVLFYLPVVWPTFWVDIPKYLWRKYVRRCQR